MKDQNREVLDGGTLPALLARRARSSSDRRLVLDAAAGLLVAVLVAALRPPLWPGLAGVSLGLACYGFWGIVDREVGERAEHPSPALGWLRAAIAFIGATVAAAGCATLFFGLIGPWIS